MARFVTKGPARVRFTPDDPPAPKYDAIIEGMCPNDGAQLERRGDDLGWCPTCGFGYSLRSTGIGESTLTVGFEVDTTAFDAAFER